VCSLLAGNCALEIFYSNSNCIDDGASDDIYRVLTDIYRMIGKYGMSEYSKLPMLELNDIDITSQMRNDI
jgi:ATP-dependent Zn protease